MSGACRVPYTEFPLVATWDRLDTRRLLFKMALATELRAMIDIDCGEGSSKSDCVEAEPQRVISVSGERVTAVLCLAGKVKIGCLDCPGMTGGSRNEGVSIGIYTRAPPGETRGSELCTMKTHIEPIQPQCYHERAMQPDPHERGGRRWARIGKAIISRAGRDHRG